MMSTPSEVTALLACIRLYLGTISTDEVTGLLTANLNWENLVQTAIANGVMPILYQSLKMIDREYVPQSVLIQLQALNRMNGLNNLSQIKELLKILAELKKNGIEAIAFKGAVLAAIYGNMALRQYNDLDILVRRQDFWQAKDILTNQGYQSTAAPQIELAMFKFHLQISLSLGSPEAKMFNQRFQPSLLHSNLERSIDLHWGIPPRRIWNSDRFEQFWQNLDTVFLVGQPVKTFSPEATLLIQCLNVTKEISRKRSFKQVCDVAQIIQIYPNLNWHLLLELATNLRTEKLCLQGLGITSELLHMPLPEFILSKLVKRDQNLNNIFEGDRKSENLAETLWSEYLNQLRDLDSWRDWLFITAHYLQFLLLALLPNQQDSELLPLPQGLSFLYFIIRPFRLLLKYSPIPKIFLRPTKN